MATSPLGGFADLSDYTPTAIARRRALQVSPLDALLQGVQQGIALEQLPQQLEQQALNAQLQQALQQAKLEQLQNPQLAAQRQLQQAAIEGIISGRNPNLVFQPQVDPQVQALRDVALQEAGVPQPTSDFQQLIAASAGVPAIGISPSAGLSAAEDKFSREMALLQAKPYAQVLTKEGFAFNPRIGRLERVILPTDNLGLEERRTNEARSIADAKTDAAQDLLQQRQEFTADENEKNRQSRETLADKRAKLASSTPPQASQYQAERQKRVLDSVTDLEQDVGYDTVGFADWFKAVPTTPAKNFAGRLKTLKAAIAFGELTAMREASKTGGALGQVSNIELGLLESALGNLDQAQSPSEFKEELGKIRGSIQRWQEASAKASTPSGGAPTSSIDRLRQKYSR